jgi:hypothetical protein
MPTCARMLTGDEMTTSVTNIPNLYLCLAIKYFERAEKAASPALQAKLREVAGEYRDQALHLMALQLNASHGSAGARRLPAVALTKLARASAPAS